MGKLYKKILSVFLPIPLFLAMTFCCCIDEEALAGENHSDVSAEQHHGAHESKEVNHSEHKGHSDTDHECTCAKHLSFLSGQPSDIVIDSPLNPMLAKSFMANLSFNDTIHLASLSNQSQGPPLQDYLHYASIPIYLKVSNLRL